MPRRYDKTTNNSIFGSAISLGTKILRTRDCAIPSHNGPLCTRLKYWLSSLGGTADGGEGKCRTTIPGSEFLTRRLTSPGAETLAKRGSFAISSSTGICELTDSRNCESFK